jgi:predicted HTH transcriptional regulator
MESVLYRNRPQYYQAIEDARKANDSGAFIQFTLSAILDTIEAQARHIDEHTSGSVSGEDGFAEKFAENADEFVEKFVENETQRAIIRLLIAQPAISAKRMAEEVGMSSRGVQKSIDVLKKRGLVERIGSAKGGYWLVKKPD